MTVITDKRKRDLDGEELSDAVKLQDIPPVKSYLLKEGCLDGVRGFFKADKNGVTMPTHHINVHPNPGACVTYPYTFVEVIQIKGTDVALYKSDWILNRGGNGN